MRLLFIVWPLPKALPSTIDGHEIKKTIHFHRSDSCLKIFLIQYYYCYYNTIRNTRLDL